MGEGVAVFTTRLLVSSSVSHAIATKELLLVRERLGYLT